MTAPAPPQARNRLATASLVLILSSIGLQVVAFLAGVAAAASVAGQGDVTLAWAPLLFPYAAAFVSVPMTLVGFVLALVALTRPRHGRAVAALWILAASVAALLLIYLALSVG